ncbi:hypothetical protein SAMN05216414_11726 [Nitrosovibrio sp. Nv17]|nr:hypothetical protein SAMN05216414_11726 [Nitrosovibrio sp. Nv17]
MAVGVRAHAGFAFESIEPCRHHPPGVLEMTFMT